MMDTVAPTGLSFKAQMRRAREGAIVGTVCRLMADKGFDAMTVDEVAAAVGIAKPSLYKHFPSKEDLAAAAMAHVLQRAGEYVAEVPLSLPPLKRLHAVLRWAAQVHLAGDLPILPGPRSPLRATLSVHPVYLAALRSVSAPLEGWIREAQADGSLNAALPPQAVLYALYARACDPLISLLQGTGQYSDDEILDLALSACFDGLRAR